MRSKWNICLATVMLILSVTGGKLAGADEPANDPKGPPAATPGLPTPAQAIEKGLSFIVSDALKWRTEQGCATCHHGTLSVWALGETSSQGFAVAAEAFSEIMRWSKYQTS